MGLIARTLVQTLKTKSILNKNYAGVIQRNQLYKFSTGSFQAAERKFSEKHEWVIINGKIGTVGISQYAQDALGDIVYAQLPDVGSEFALMDECGALESVKAASELFCPLSGKVTEKNTEVEAQPGLINKSCYDKGWLFKMELTKPEEVKDLLSESQYEKFLKSLSDEADAQ